MALEQAILQQDPDLPSRSQPARRVDSCPWPGLQAYDVDDADWFFGRESEVADCLEVLRDPAPARAGRTVRVGQVLAAARRASAPRCVPAASVWS